VIECVNNKRNVLGKVNLTEPLSFKKLGRTVNKVCCENLADPALFISFIKGIETIAEKTEGTANIDVSCTHILKTLCNVNHRIAGGNHIVNNDNVLALKARA
jgi:hypothetical protein